MLIMFLEPDLDAEITNIEIISDLYLQIAKKDKLISELKMMVQELYVLLKITEYSNVNN